MDFSKLDPTLQGVIIGTLLSLAGGLLTQLLGFWREDRSWARQHKAERDDLEIQDRKKKIEYVQNIYNNCMSRLSAIASNDDDDGKITDDESAKILVESFEWVAKLKLYHRDLYSDVRSPFHLRVDDFLRTPDSWRARSLLSEINKIFVVDQLLFPLATPIKSSSSGKSAQMIVSDVYRREQMIRGIELPGIHTFQFDISDLSDKQREILWDIHHESHRGVPDHVVLTTPHYNEQQKKITFTNAQWHGRINPLVSEPKQIFEEWEKDYLVELEQANKLQLIQKPETKNSH